MTHTTDSADGGSPGGPLVSRRSAAILGVAGTAGAGTAMLAVTAGLDLAEVVMAASSVTASVAGLLDRLGGR